MLNQHLKLNGYIPEILVLAFGRNETLFSVPRMGGIFNRFQVAANYQS
jgi:hypothetical protein